MFDEPLFDIDTPDPIELTCSHCGSSVSLSEDGARLNGWRIIHSTSQSGSEYHDVLCGSCSGRGEYVPPPTWDWQCKNCGRRFTDDYTPPRDPPLLTVDEAWHSAARHRCEPHFDFLAPGTTTWVPDWEPLLISSLSAD